MAAAAPAADHYPPRATSVAHAWLREPLYRELQAEAIRRGEHVDALAAKILTSAILLGAVDELVDQAQASLVR